jgi:hypothetical protein
MFSVHGPGGCGRARVALVAAAMVVVFAFGAARAAAAVIGLDALACPSATQCTAADVSGRVVTFDPVAATAPIAAMIDSGNALSGIACPSRSQCTAVDAVGELFTFDPVALNRPATVVALPRTPRTPRLLAIACPSVSQCTAVTYRGAEVTFDPRSPGRPKAIPVEGGQMSDDYQPFTLSGITAITCPSVTRCIGVDNQGNEGPLDPRHPPPPFNQGSGNGGVDERYISANPLDGLACITATRCVTVDNAGNEYTFTQHSGGNGRGTKIDGGRTINGVSCPSVRVCAAVDGAGDEVTFDPAAPRTSHIITPIDSGTSLGAVACPSPRRCVAVGGEVELSFAPVSPGSAAPIVIDSVPTVAASAAGATDFGHGHAKLVFTLTAPTGAPLISAVTVALPAGLAFATSVGQLNRGVAVTAAGAAAPSSESVTGGTLTITLTSPAASIQIALTRPAITATKAAADAIRAGTISALGLAVAATSTSGVTTRLIVSAPAS